MNGWHTPSDLCQRHPNPFSFLLYRIKTHGVKNLAYKFRWLAEVKDGKIKIPKAAYETIHSLEKNGTLLLVDIELVGDIVK